MKHLLFLLFPTFSILLFAGCQHPNHEGGTPSPKDTLHKSELLTPLPDTIFPSVDNLEYTITIFDSLTDGHIGWFEDPYEKAPGTLTFRRNHYRNADYHGTLQGRPDTVLIDWVFTTGFDKRVTKFGSWGGGTGWTGQPLYVEWPDSCMERFRKESPALTRHFDKEEIIIGSLDAHLYFINFQTGDSSRRSFYVGNTIKGTPSLDPTLNGNLYVGQGVPCTHPFGVLQSL